jgi:FNIP Repeat
MAPSSLSFLLPHPEALKHLKYQFSPKTPQPLAATVPPAVTELEVGDLNQPIDFLPPNLKKFTLGVEFNHPLPHHLPESLTWLSLGDSFNQPVESLPLSLHYLSLGHKYNQPLNKLPPKLLQLEIDSKDFNQPLDYLPLFSSCIF